MPGHLYSSDINARALILNAVYDNLDFLRFRCIRFVSVRKLALVDYRQVVGEALMRGCTIGRAYSK